MTFVFVNPKSRRKELEMEQEIWKPVVGYEGRYEVSNLGRVKSLPRCLIRANGRAHPQPEKIFKQSPDRAGYMRVGLYSLDNAKRLNKLVHRLVCEAFHGPSIGDKKFVNHKDLNKANNLVDNLEWVTNQENMDHAAAHGVYNPIRRKSPVPRQSVSTEVALRLKVEVESGISSGTLDIPELSRRFGMSVVAVRCIASGLTWSDVQKRHRVKRPLNNPFVNTGRRVKLTPASVLEMRSLAGTLSYAELGRRFGVSWTTARGVVLGLYWKGPTTSP